ncbi:ATP-binding protein [Streptomyces boninensis]|uniref:ATP-binding protein n=1 Tax=Streptomyces boninensis TaxID=2039455 RepID=UPI003B224162
MNAADNAPALTPARITTCTRARRFPNAAAAVQQARTFTDRVLAKWTPAVDLDLVRLCVSELCTNALAPDEPAHRSIVVRLAVDADALRIEVHDTKPGVPAPRDPEPDDISGRGLLIVDTVADRWDVQTRSGPGKVVWAEFDLTHRPATTPGTQSSINGTTSPNGSARCRLVRKGSAG